MPFFSFFTRGWHNDGAAMYSLSLIEVNSYTEWCRLRLWWDRETHFSLGFLLSAWLHLLKAHAEMESCSIPLVHDWEYMVLLMAGKAKPWAYLAVTHSKICWFSFFCQCSPIFFIGYGGAEEPSLFLQEIKTKQLRGFRSPLLVFMQMLSRRMPLQKCHLLPIHFHVDVVLILGL